MSDLIEWLSVALLVSCKSPLQEMGVLGAKLDPAQPAEEWKQNELECEPVSILQRKNTGLAGIGSN